MVYLKFPSRYSQGFLKSHGLSQVSLTVLSRFSKVSWFISSFPHGTLKYETYPSSLDERVSNLKVINLGDGLLQCEGIEVCINQVSKHSFVM